MSISAKMGYERSHFQRIGMALILTRKIFVNITQNNVRQLAYSYACKNQM